MKTIITAKFFFMGINKQTKERVIYTETTHRKHHRQIGNERVRQIIKKEMEEKFPETAWCKRYFEIERLEVSYVEGQK